MKRPRVTPADALLDTLRAEVRKVFTLPALRLTVLVTVVGTALLATAVRRAGMPGAAVLGSCQAGFLVLGVLAAAQEYQAGGQIRATLLATPRRLRLLAAKTTALAAVTAPVAVAVAAVAGSRPVQVGAYLTLVTLLSAATATLLRGTLPALVVVLAVHLITGPVLRARFPAGAAWLPDTALYDFARGAPATAGWTAVVLLVAAVAFHRRDA